MSNQQLAIMEQIAMYMTALPCPPLPVSVAWVQKGEPNRMVFASSHDVLAGLLVSAMRRDNAALNKLRQAKQLAITDQFITTLEKCVTIDCGCDACPGTVVGSCGIKPDHVAAYDACKRFTAEYILAFDDDNCGSGLQFSDMEDVERGDKVHKATCSWHAAQDIQHASIRRTADHFAKMTYAELIAEHVTRVCR
jgi:hypothetical protein